MDGFDNRIMLVDEDGEEVLFEFLDLIEVDGREFAVLLPAGEEGCGSEVVILRVDETDGSEDEAYSPVEDAASRRRVWGIFKERFRDVFNFLDAPTEEDLFRDNGVSCGPDESLGPNKRSNDSSYYRSILGDLWVDDQAEYLGLMPMSILQRMAAIDDLRDDLDLAIFSAVRADGDQYFDELKDLGFIDRSVSRAPLAGMSDGDLMREAIRLRSLFESDPKLIAFYPEAAMAHHHETNEQPVVYEPSGVSGVGEATGSYSSTTTSSAAVQRVNSTIEPLFSCEVKPNASVTGQTAQIVAMSSNVADLILESEIENMDLTVRTYNCLKRVNIRTVRQLLERSEADLLCIRGLNMKSIEEIKGKLEAAGFSLKNEISS